MNSPKDYLTDRVKKLEELWKRIEKTMTGHISGRRIWDADTEGDDDEANYLFVDETLKTFLTETIEQSMEVGYRKGFNDAMTGELHEYDGLKITDNK